MKGFFTYLIYKYSGLSEIIKEINNSINIDPYILRLIRPHKYPPKDSMEILKELLSIANINDVEIKRSVNANVDLRRKMAAIAANVTPLEIENPEEILWKIAEKLRVRR
ncbi:MAG: RNase L inhibitor [Sulfolobaceae archaeon]